MHIINLFNVTLGILPRQSFACIKYLFGIIYFTMKNLRIKIASLLVIGAAVGSQAFAQYIPGGSSTSVSTWTSSFGGWLGSVRYIVIVIALLFVMINGIRFMFEDGEKKTEAQSRLIRSVIGLFVILAILGIIAVISRTLGIGIGGELQNELVPGVGQFPG